jgi:hypothetical protein
VTKTFYRPDIKWAQARVLADYLEFALTNKPEQTDVERNLVSTFLNNIGQRDVIARIAPSLYDLPKPSVEEVFPTSEGLRPPKLSEYKDRSTEDLQMILEMQQIPIEHRNAIEIELNIREVRAKEQEIVRIRPPKPNSEENPN